MNWLSTVVNVNISFFSKQYNAKAHEKYLKTKTIFVFELDQSAKVVDVVAVLMKFCSIKIAPFMLQINRMLQKYSKPQVKLN